MLNSTVRRRTGITPVVSIVLLLMMTVAAAGAAYSWFTEIQEDIQNRATDRLQTSVGVRDLQCVIDTDSTDVDGNALDDVVIALKNTGSRDILGSAVDVYIYDNNGDLYTAITGMDWTQTVGSSHRWTMGSPSDGFLKSGGFGQVSVDLPSSSQYDSSDFYTATIEFTDSQVSEPLGGCIAQ